MALRMQFTGAECAGFRDLCYVASKIRGKQSCTRESCWIDPVRHCEVAQYQKRSCPCTQTPFIEIQFRFESQAGSLIVTGF